MKILKLSREIILGSLGLTACLGLHLATNLARAADSDLIPQTNVNLIPNTGVQSETSIAINPQNPQNIVASANNVSFSGAVTGRVATFISQNGGATWASAPSSPSTSTGNTFTSGSDPWVAFDGQGNAFLAYILFNRDTLGKPTTGAIGVAKLIRVPVSGPKSCPGPSPTPTPSWGPMVPIVEHLNPNTARFEDKEAMAIDQSNGNIYVSWTHFNQIPFTDVSLGARIYFSRSTDGGTTFSTPLKLTPDIPDSVQYSMPAVAPNGDVYVAWSNWVTHTIDVARSKDHGATFLPPVVVGSFKIPLPATPSRSGYTIPAQPDRGIVPNLTIACDKDNNVYVAWCDLADNVPLDQIGPSANTDIFVRKSTTKGLTWTALGSVRKRVNNDSDTASQFNPAMAIDPVDNSVNISYYDTRDDSTNAKTNYFLSRSIDGGQSFADTRVTTVQSDESIANTTRDPNNYGDYSSIAARGGVVFANWTDTRSGTENTFVARIASCNSRSKLKVINANNSGQGSLRQALSDAAACTDIEFNIPACGVTFATVNFSIIPQTALPPVNGNGIKIDGTTELDFLGGSLTTPNRPIITVSGTTVPNASGLAINSGISGTTIRGLAINSFAGGIGVDVRGPRTVIEDCWLTGNGEGLHLFASADNCLVTNNQMASNNGFGIVIESAGNQVGLNMIGTDPTGVAAAGNGAGGILIKGNKNIIGKDGLNGPGENIISGNGSLFIPADGILVEGARDNIIGLNRIGTDAAGNLPLPNSGSGIRLQKGASSNVIGAGKPGRGGNLISGNKGSGIVITSKSTRNTVAGNLLGSDISGRVALPNNGDGIQITDGAVNNLIGGADRRWANVISGNKQNGVVLVGAQTRQNTLWNNFIGIQNDGATSLPNQSNGVLIWQGASKNVIGGDSEGTGNIIAFNADNGVRIGAPVSADPIQNLISRNSIYGNHRIGIDLVGGAEDAAGSTANDDKDSDGGANQLQNPPLLVRFDRDGRTIRGTLNSTPNTSFVIEIFVNKRVAAGSPLQGEILAGRITGVTTDAGGNASFSFSIKAAHLTLPVTAIAIDPEGNSSEFSPALESNVARRSFWGQLGDSIQRIVNGVLRGLGLRRKPAPARIKS